MKFLNYNSVPFLCQGIRQKGGRNFQGKITVRHRGGGHKQFYRSIDWNRKQGNGIIVGFEYDPQRTAYLAKVFHKNSVEDKKNSYSYILAPNGSKIFQEVNVYGKFYDKSKSNIFIEEKDNNKLLQIGDSTNLSSFEAGDFIHNVEAYPGKGPIFARSAGSFCQVLSMTNQISSVADTQSFKRWAKIRLPSGSVRYASENCRATFGIVSQNKFKNQNLLKAGRSRWLGWRPSVRGVAMNPVDHPHGGGQGKTSGGRPSVTFKSWPTKGGWTTRSVKRKNRLIINSRKI